MIEAPQELIGQDFFDAAFGYWFDDPQSPFPAHMREKLTELCVPAFMRWHQGVGKLTTDEEACSDQLTQLMFSIGLSLCRSEQERIDLTYPTMPRLGARVNFKRHASRLISGTVVERKLLVGRKRLIIAGPRRLDLWVRVRLDDGKFWETSFRLR